MGYFPPMTSQVTPVRHQRTVYVSVEHDPGQSYSRAVAPRAKRDFKSWIYENVMFGELSLVSVEHSAWVVLGRTVSVYTFTY